MGRIKKAAKGALAVGTLGASVAAEKAVKAGAEAVASRRGEDGSADLDPIVATTPEAEADLPPASTQADPDVLFVAMSHEEGRNAKVTLYRDRIERTKERSRMSMSKAHQDVEVTALKSVSSVQAKKAGIRTNVTVYAAGNNIDFRFGHGEARTFAEAITALILEGTSVQVVAAALPAAPDVADQIKKLAELRDAGVLTDEEFNAKKTELLGRI
jgi:hypothetical protein